MLLNEVWSSVYVHRSEGVINCGNCARRNDVGDTVYQDRIVAIAMAMLRTLRAAKVCCIAVSPGLQGAGYACECVITACAHRM
jgi:predicted GNAT family acetyltransferase